MSWRGGIYCISPSALAVNSTREEPRWAEAFFDIDFLSEIPQLHPLTTQKIKARKIIISSLNSWEISLPSLPSTPHRIAYRWGYYLRKYFVAAKERRRTSPETAKSAETGGEGGNKHILLLVYHFIVSISRASSPKSIAFDPAIFCVSLFLQRLSRETHHPAAAQDELWASLSHAPLPALPIESTWNSTLGAGIINISRWGALMAEAFGFHQRFTKRKRRD